MTFNGATTLTISGREVLIDDADLELVATHNWSVIGKGTCLYVKSHKCGYLHRFLMDAQAGQMVDHRNRNSLDNRRSNLRFCTHAQNQQNKQCKRGSSQFKGVLRDGNRWRAYIGFEGKQIWLGSFRNEDDAARMHDKAARVYHGEFAILNFQAKAAS